MGLAEPLLLERSRLCCSSSLEASRGGLFPGIGVGIGIRPAWGAAPLQGLVLCCSLSWVYALGMAGKPRQEWSGTIRSLPSPGFIPGRDPSLALLVDFSSPGWFLGFLPW